MPQTTPEATETAPQGVDISAMPMAAYAQVRAQLGVTGREFGRGALDGGSTADWVAAARAKSGRTQYGRQQAAQQIDGSKYLTANEPVTGRANFYR